MSCVGLSPSALRLPGGVAQLVGSAPALVLALRPYAKTRGPRLDIDAQDGEAGSILLHGSDKVLPPGTMVNSSFETPRLLT